MVLLIMLWKCFSSTLDAATYIESSLLTGCHIQCGTIFAKSKCLINTYWMKERRSKAGQAGTKSRFLALNCMKAGRVAVKEADRIPLGVFSFFLLHCSTWVIFAPWPGIEPRPQQRRCRVPTTGPPGTSYLRLFRQDFQSEQSFFWQTTMKLFPFSVLFPLKPLLCAFD